MKVPFITDVDLELLLEKMSTCHSNPEKSLTTKINKHIAPDNSLFTHCSFDTTKNKFDHHRGKNCMKNFFLDLRKHATKTINFEKKEMIPLTEEERKMHRKQKICYICKKEFSTDDSNKNTIK